MKLSEKLVYTDYEEARDEVFESVCKEVEDDE